ncbi:MAG TPA: ATP-binding protein [Phycisphaerae bacterium]|nr:ATP-binding protein [Phycisphaerae bacterium]
MMAKKRGISISLAAKCQLLFGLAVLVIIAGALAVPWQRMEQLAGQPNVKAARFAADLLFRQIHAQAPDRSHSSTAAVAAASTAPWTTASLADIDFPEPRLYPVSGPALGFLHKAGAEDSLGNQSLALFRAHPQETETGNVVSTTGKTGEKSLIYRYFAAVRLDASCLKCHSEYASWVREPLSAHAATRDAMPESAPLTEPATETALHSALPDASTEPAPTVVPAPTGETASWPVVAVIRVDVPYQTDENQLLLNRIVIVVAGMVGGTLAIVVFYLITSRLILQPVRVLKNTAEKVAAGDLKIRSAISTGDEFQHLSETFNTMLATLQASQNQLEATNRSLDTRVGELAQSNVDLFEANRLKSEFLTNVTHELRTPLNAIIGFADLMAETAKTGGDAKQQRYCENIRLSARQLLDLINDLLDLAKIEAGKLVLREEKVNVADVCEAMANFMRPLAQKKNIDFVLNISPDMPLITTDPGRFQQILYNFLSNAIKFTPPDGQVTIMARNEDIRGGGESAIVGGVPSGEGLGAGGGDASIAAAGVGAIRVDISDTGPGISVEDQRVIFEKFRQIDGSVTRQHSGTGLGLAISRELANMLGGRIELKSEAGKGATFSLIIPQLNPRSGPVEVRPTLENA